MKLKSHVEALPIETQWAIVVAAVLLGFGLGLLFCRTQPRTQPTRATTDSTTTRATTDSTTQATTDSTTTRGDAQRPRRAKSSTASPETRYVLVYAAEARGAQLEAAITMRCVHVKNALELLTEAKRNRPVAAFVDVDLLPQLNGKLAGIPIVGLVDATPAESLRSVVRSLDAFPALSSVVVAPLWETQQGRDHLTGLLERLVKGHEHDLLGAASIGRVAMLTQASRREARFERMHDYLSKQDLSPRVISMIQEIAEELVMNALYNAPSEAGYFKQPVSRTEDVTLPLDRACEISYGMEAGEVFVRVRDTFGSLRRDRLLEVLNRCMETDVILDESRGGAGLGMWRIFSAASAIAITVIPDRLTDILVRVGTKPGRSAKQLRAAHFYFFSTIDGECAFSPDDDSLVDHSITLIQA